MANDNKRIVKNTLLLYFRMLFLAVVSLFTVRVVLGALGDVDYGISSVIGSTVYMLGFLIGTMASASQRYFAYSLGKNDIAGYRKVFSMLLICFWGFCGIIILIGEAVSPWVVTDWLNIPEDRQWAAQWVYQTSLLQFMLTMLQVPYTASIVAHERMQGFAYISIADGLFKLGIAYLVMVTDIDRLVFYSVISTIETALILLLYYAFCRKNFEGCRFSFLWDKKLFKELTGYTGWNLFGSISGILCNQGQGILLNIYFGPVINAAKGIADKIYSIVVQLSTNFYMAVSPQIVKSYASGNSERMDFLAIVSTKMSFFLLTLVVFPAIAVMDPLLHIWLREGDVTRDMVLFAKLMLVFSLVNSLEQPITQMIRATGKIKRYQLSVGIVTILYLPIAWLSLRLGGSPQATLWTLIAVMAFVMIIRVNVARRQVGFPVGDYLRQAILPICLVSAALIGINFLLEGWKVGNVWMLFLKGGSLVAISAVVIIALGMTTKERTAIRNALKKKLLARRS